MWTSEDIVILDVTVSNDLNSFMSKNYAPVIDQIEVVSNLWNNQSLSLSRRILVINTLMASLLTYKMKVLCNITPAICEKKIIRLYTAIYGKVKKQRCH